MPPTGVKSAKRARQYEHIKDSALKQGRSTRRAKQIAAATVNKERREKGETKGSRKRTGGGRKKTSGSRKTGARKSAARKSTSRKTSARKTSSRKTSTRKTASRKRRGSAKKR
jgi:hypothetical protein